MKVHGFRVTILSKQNMFDNVKEWNYNTLRLYGNIMPSVHKYTVKEFFSDGLNYKEKYVFWTNDKYEFRIRLKLIGCTGKIGMITKSLGDKGKCRTRYISYYDE